LTGGGGAEGGGHDGEGGMYGRGDQLDGAGCVWLVGSCPNLWLAVVRARTAISAGMLQSREGTRVSNRRVVQPNADGGVSSKVIVFKE
jgi:hypothetical protein